HRIRERRRARRADIVGRELVTGATGIASRSGDRHARRVESRGRDRRAGTSWEMPCNGTVRHSHRMSCSRRSCPSPRHPSPRRPDSAAVTRTYGVGARSFSSLAHIIDSLVATKLPVYTLADFSDADFARSDSLTRGGQFARALSAKHPGLVVKDAHGIVDELRAKKSDAELALLRKAAEISSEGHRAAMLAPEPNKEYEIQAAIEGTFLR